MRQRACIGRQGCCRIKQRAMPRRKSVGAAGASLFSALCEFRAFLYERHACILEHCIILLREMVLGLALDALALMSTSVVARVPSQSGQGVEGARAFSSQGPMSAGAGSPGRLAGLAGTTMPSAPAAASRS